MKPNSLKKQVVDPQLDAGKIILLLPTPMKRYSRKKRSRPPELDAGWSSLQDELLGFILQWLGVSDYVRFGSVCRNWNRVFAEKRHPPAPQDYWLWDPHKGVNGFYCLSERKWYGHLYLPRKHWRDWQCCGSQYGWLMFLPRCSLKLKGPFLANPFSRELIILPALKCLDFIPDCPHFRTNIGEKLYCSLPPDDPLCAFACLNSCGVMAICTSKSTWVVLNNYLSSPRSRYASAIFFKGSLYATSRRGELCLVDLASPNLDGRPTVQTVLPSPRDNKLFSEALLLEHQGELMMCFLNGIPKVHTFELFRANLEIPKWEAVKNFGPKQLITSDYWRDFMPVLKNQLATPLERFKEFDSNKSLYYCTTPYDKIMLSPRPR